MFITALSTIAKLWKQPKCPSIDEWIKKIPHNGILFSHKKNEISPFAITWMDLESIMLSKVSQRKIPHDFTHMWNLRNTQRKKKETETNQETDS